MHRKITLLCLLLCVGACSSSTDSADQLASFVEHVNDNKLGADNDHWVEMKNMSGEWEKTMLVFGYYGDFEECQKAIAGLRAANEKREYRCVPAQQK